MAEDGPRGSRIEIKIPLGTAIDFGQGRESVYKFGWEIPDSADGISRLIPVPTRRHKEISQALLRLTDETPFHFSTSGDYLHSLTSQRGTSKRRRGGYAGRDAA